MHFVETFRVIMKILLRKSRIRGNRDFDSSKKFPMKVFQNPTFCYRTSGKSIGRCTTLFQSSIPVLSLIRTETMGVSTLKGSYLFRKASVSEAVKSCKLGQNNDNLSNEAVCLSYLLSKH